MNASMRILALLALPAAAQAQESAPPPERWAIGVCAAGIESPYAGEGERIRAFPLLSYEGERVFLRGISGGVHLVEARGFRLDAILAARLDGFDIDDLGRDELRANGVDHAWLSDRDDGLDAGMRLSHRSPAGVIALEGLHDVTGASEGYELKFLPDELRDSPLLEPDQQGMARVMIGLSRRF